MNAKTYSNILKGIFVTSVWGIIALLLWGNQLIEFAGESIVYIILSIALWPYVLSFIPARCNKPECLGQMRPRWVKGSDYGLRLQYKCDSCADVYTTNFTIGLGEPGSW